MADKPKVYVETTVVSYLTAWPSNEIVMAAHQQITQRWWQSRREEFELFASELVVQEAQAGDADAARRRLAVIGDLDLITIDDSVTQLAELLAQEISLPKRASADALHIGLAVVHGMDYLMTWNCRHIANARHRQRIEDICSSAGYLAPVICTPEELLGEIEDVP